MLSNRKCISTAQKCRQNTSCLVSLPLHGWNDQNFCLCRTNGRLFPSPFVHHQLNGQCIFWSWSRKICEAACPYYQMMLSYGEQSVEQTAVIKSFRSNGSHVMHYSSHEWARIWSDVWIEQTLMKIAESDGCLLGGKFRNGESHFTLINWLTQKLTSKKVHRGLALAQRLAEMRRLLTRSKIGWHSYLIFNHVA